MAQCPGTGGDAAAALHDPLAYPGEGVPFSSMLVGDRLLPTPPGEFCTELRRLGATPMAERTPILAVWSNGSAVRLLARFGVSGTVIPILPVRVLGLRRGFMAGVCPQGFVPIAPVADPDARTVLRMVWLEPEQLRSLDEDAPNHTRVHFDNGVVGADVYRSRFRVLRDLDSCRPMAARNQRSLFAALCTQEWFAEIVARWVGQPAAGVDPAPRIAAALAGSAKMRDAVRKGFVENELVCEDAL